MKKKISHSFDCQMASKVILKRALVVLETATKNLEHSLAAAKTAQDDIDAKTRLADIKALNAALLFALKMQEATRAATQQDTEGQGAGALDLDAARDEISRRLACLRTARGDANLP
jgi:hypothetical protein